MQKIRVSGESKREAVKIGKSEKVYMASDVPVTYEYEPSMTFGFLRLRPSRDLKHLIENYALAPSYVEHSDGSISLESFSFVRRDQISREVKK